MWLRLLSWLLLAALGAGQQIERQPRQIQFNLGSLFGQPNNNNNNENAQRIDLAGIAGGLLGFNNNRPNQGGQQNPDLIGSVIGGLASSADVKVDFKDGKLQVGVVPAQSFNSDDIDDDAEFCSLDLGGGGGGGGRRRPGGGDKRGRPNFGPGGGGTDDCRCWEKRINYLGGDLRIRNNPSQVASARDCQISCQNTPGCSHWTFLRKSRRKQSTSCWLKSAGFIRTNHGQHISGPRTCSGSGGVIVSNVCVTVSGPNTGATCVFPFIYKGVQYNGCTLVDAENNQPWCSTQVDSTGTHVSGAGQYGNCGPGCDKAPTESAATPATVSVSGDPAAVGVDQIPWFPKGGNLAIPVGAQISNRFLSFGLNEPDTGHGTCKAPGGGSGSCRHIQHCLKPAYFDFVTFLTHICIIENKFVGVCCPDPEVIPVTVPPVVIATSAPLRACGTNAKSFQTRIVGGRPADPNEWPWLAALLRPSTGDSGQFCGAALISDRHVLTAAHCLAPFTQDQIRVKLGEYDFKKEGETADKVFNVLTMKTHEAYNSSTYENDIGIITLDRTVETSNSIWPVCLPSASEVFTDTRAYVVGWGTIYFGGPTSDVLQEVNVRIWDNKDCAANYGKLKREIRSTMLCAGDVSKDACQGDSGGPLNCRDPETGNWRLCGIVSWGARCAEPDFPGVYTRVTDYLDWIKNNAV